MKNWGFYGRNPELAEFERIIGRGRWFFCSVTGRRRIGKTTLIQRALAARGGGKCLYCQTPDSDEGGVVQTFREAAEDALASRNDAGLVAGGLKMRTFRDMARFIADLCEKSWIIVIDEFQYFHHRRLAPFASFLQAEVDRLRDTGAGGIFVLGSIQTEMTALLEDRNAPLFNRVTDRLHLDHWDFATLFEMFDAHGVVDEAQQLFLWSLFEGVPKFYRDCAEQGVLGTADEYRETTLRRLFFEGSSPLRDEADNSLLRELRGAYVGVLKAVAGIGPCSLGELRDEYARAGHAGEGQLGPYLKTLVERYRMIEKQNPVFAPPRGRKTRYAVADNFLLAWLGVVQRNVNAARVQPLDGPLRRASDMLREHEGRMFEKLTRRCIEEMSRKDVGDFKLTEFVHGYWNKAGKTDIEIDAVVLNEDDKVVRFGSCKRSRSGHTDAALTRFEGHIERFLRTGKGRRLVDWRRERALYAPRFDDDDRNRLAARGYRCYDLQDFRLCLYPKSARPRLA